MNTTTEKNLTDRETLSDLVEITRAMCAEVRALREHLGAPASKLAVPAVAVIGMDVFGMPITTDTATSA